MNCPGCGFDLKGKGICSRCGAKIEDSIEVEYKDFKISELLEIRHIKHKTGHKETKQAKLSEKVVDTVRAKNAGAARVENTGNNNDRTRAKNARKQFLSRDRKTSKNIIRVVLLVLAIIAGVFFVWRFQL